MNADFARCFAQMFSAKIPDLGMKVESAPPLVRYIGDGIEPFYYSIKCNSACSLGDFKNLVHQEVHLAANRNRSSFEWKVFEITKMSFQAEILRDANFECRRISRLRFAPSKLTSTDHPSVYVKRVESDSDFNTLLDINESAFGSRSLWLENSLKLEIKAMPELVQAFIAFVDGKPACAAWIKIFNKVGFLFGGGTVPELRNRGAYKCLVQSRAAFAEKAGADFVLSECSADSDRVLAALGFEDGGTAEQWIYPAK